MMTNGLDLIITHLQNEKSSMCAQNPGKVKQTQRQERINVKSHPRRKYFLYMTVIQSVRAMRKGNNGVTNNQDKHGIMPQKHWVKLL